MDVFFYIRADDEGLDVPRLNNGPEEALRTTPVSQREISVDSLEVAQFIYLLLNNEKIRRVIDAITSKVVLLLGRFTTKRKMVLDALRDALRARNYLPVAFDFEKSASRDLTETISVLACMARFVIADITDAGSIPQELMAIVPNLPSVPVQPLLPGSQSECGMCEHLRNYRSVLKEVVNSTQEQLITGVEALVIRPVEEWLETTSVDRTDPHDSCGPGTTGE